MYRTAIEIEEKIEKACLLLNHFFSKHAMDNDMSIWFYPGGEKDVLDICINRIERYKSERGRKRLLIISTEDIDVLEHTDIYIEKVTEEQMSWILDWYVVCHPTAWIYLVISLEKPYGREGAKWINCYDKVSKDMACVTGILNLPYEE